MSVEEYIEANLPFYHLTTMDCLDSILEAGLFRSRKSGCRFGICVVRSMEDDIISEIIDCQLQITGKEKFALIELFPKEMDITADDVSIDPVDDTIAPMCNYICKEPICIERENIIRQNIPVGLWRCTKSGIVKLTDYRCPVPPINR